MLDNAIRNGCEYIVTALITLGIFTPGATIPITIDSHWETSVSGIYKTQGTCTYATSETVTEFRVNITLDKDTSSIQLWIADVVSKDELGRWYYVKNRHSSNIPPVNLIFQVTSIGNRKPSGYCSDLQGNGGGDPNASTISTTGQPAISTKETTTKGTSPLKYDYAEVIRLSVLFYAAQRSGKLPADNPISWRSDSALTDQGDNGHELTGGWYDAGDYVKFNLPMSSSTTLLVWSLIEWKEAYEKAGQLEQMYGCIKWPLDYFLKCWDEENQIYYAQVGDGTLDHKYWGRPEDMTMSRPAMKITSSKPGSDVAGGTAAAMAAASIAFKSKDEPYSRRLLNKAVSLYQFAKTYKGKYSDSYSQEFYRSSGYKDELCTAALWLYNATGDSKYMDDAKIFYVEGLPWGLSWDSSEPSAQVLLYKLTKENKYKTAVEEFLKSWMPGGIIPYTKGGLAFRLKWGSLRYAANTAFLATMAAHYGIQSEVYRNWAESQIHYILGNNPSNFSYVIGFGEKYPLQPHHASSSCPLAPAICNWNNYNSPNPNPHVLKGALVGGPDADDGYQDKRSDYVQNVVTCDYNAGFHSAIAGLYAHYIRNPPFESTRSTQKSHETTTANNDMTTISGSTPQNVENFTFSTSPSRSIKYNFAEVLRMSILFYAAQRSGKLPADNPIPWRSDSALTDQGDNGHNLTGGWYDAGDYVKFNLPMSSSTTLLLWGLIEWNEAYEKAGQLDEMYDCVKWPLDYFLKCWDETNEIYYAQVGDGKLDHKYWGRPEDMQMARPALKITSSKPGSDVAGETASALAAASIAFKSKDRLYSTKLLKKAKSLFQFAKTHKGKYSDSYPQVQEFYKSTAYRDELCTAALWLYNATGESEYLDDAKSFYDDGIPWGLSWDGKRPSAQVLMYKFTQETKYKTAVEEFMKSWMPGGTIPYTNGGLAFRLNWGSLRFAANTAFIALMAAHYGIKSEAYRKWAQSQIHYILGENPRGISYVIGFGEKYPLRPHHASSSCPLAPATCDWSNYHSPNPNPHLLKGALVGGPDANDGYQDKRSDYVHNEVTCDYNAGFQSAVAGLLFYHLSQRPKTLFSSTLEDRTRSTVSNQAKITTTTAQKMTTSTTTITTTAPTMTTAVSMITTAAKEQNTVQGTSGASTRNRNFLYSVPLSFFAIGIIL